MKPEIYNAEEKKPFFLDKRELVLVKLMIYGKGPLDIDQDVRIPFHTQKYLKHKIAEKFDAGKKLRPGFYKAIKYSIDNKLIEIDSKVVPQNPILEFNDSDIQNITQIINWLKGDMITEPAFSEQELKKTGSKIKGKPVSNGYLTVAWAARFLNNQSR